MTDIKFYVLKLDSSFLLGDHTVAGLFILRSQVYPPHHPPPHLKQILSLLIQVLTIDSILVQFYEEQ